MATQYDYDKLTPAQKGKLTRLLNKLEESRVSLRSQALYEAYCAKREEVWPDAQEEIKSIESEAKAKIELLKAQIAEIEDTSAEEREEIIGKVTAYTHDAQMAWWEASDEDWKAYRAKEEQVIAEFYAEHLGVNA
jgi:hypothetical protein